MEIRKFTVALGLVAAAGFSPAPMNEVHLGKQHMPEQSQAQVAKQQAYNGTVPVVGGVPTRVDPVGHTIHTKELSPDHKVGEAGVAAGSDRLKDAANVVSTASVRVEQQQRRTQLAWWLGIIVLGMGYAGGRAIIKKVERDTPVPTFSKSFLKKIEKGKL